MPVTFPIMRANGFSLNCRYSSCDAALRLAGRRIVQLNFERRDDALLPIPRRALRDETKQRGIDGAGWPMIRTH